MNDIVEENQLTMEQFKKVLPKQIRFMANQNLIDEVNKIIGGNSEIKENFRENIISYVSVMRGGKFKVQQYIDAVKYISFKLLGDTNESSYAKTFPDRYQHCIDRKMARRDISGYVAAYNKNKLVNLIYAQTLVPMHVLNSGIYQEALNCQVELMHQAKSEKVRCDAANSILVQLRAPETQKIELDIAVKEDSAIDALRESTLRLVAQQKLALQAGAMDAKDMAHSKLVMADPEVIEGEYVKE